MGISDADNAENPKYFGFVCKKPAHFANAYDASGLQWLPVSTPIPLRLVQTVCPVRRVRRVRLVRIAAMLPRMQRRSAAAMRARKSVNNIHPGEVQDISRWLSEVTPPVAG